MAGDLSGARALLQPALERDRSNVRALVLLGRVQLEEAGQSDWTWAAWDLFEEAWELSPDDPEIAYLQAQAGLAAGGKDGEWAIRDGLYRIWNLDPSYRDTWQLWRYTYHGKDELEQAVTILARHPGNPTADLRRAQLLIELGKYDEADRLLAARVEAGDLNAAVWALMAQSALEAGDTATGLAHYAAAVGAAATDSLGIMWRQVETIASPEEDRAWAAASPDEWEAFYGKFWAQREPYLITAGNDRVAEHFARLKRARRDYRLLHPQSAFHRSPGRRNMVANISPTVFAMVQSLGVPGIMPQMSSRLEADLQAAGVGTDVRALPEPDSVSRYRRYGFDGRGLIYLRFGEPLRRYVMDGGQVEAWYYEVAGEPMVAVFARATGATASGTGTALGGDMVVFPTTRPQVRYSVELLERDTTSIEASLDVHAWVATFRGPATGDHIVYVGATPDSGAAALWNLDWVELDRVAGVSPFVFRAGAGALRLGVDVQARERLGRLRAEIEITNLWRDRLTVSSILIGAASDTGFGRDEVAAAMPGTRRLPAGVPLALYSEIYDLPADAAGLAQYEVEYAFVPQAGGETVRIAFDRQAPSNPTILERIVLAPGDVPRGSYQITMTVRDRVAGREEHSTLGDVDLR